MNLLLDRTIEINEVTMNQGNNQIKAEFEAEKKEMLTNLRHQLRSPMTVTKSYSVMARDSGEEENCDEVKNIF